MLRKTAAFRFFGSLNDFLSAQRREGEWRLDFQGDQSVKHLFESCGAPHPEVGRLLANGQSIDQGYIVQDGDRIEVRPFTPPVPRPDPARFVLDNHLGRLAAYLRLLGFDATYRNDIQDEELAQTSGREERILLTRDVRLLMRSLVVYGYWVRSKIPRQQILEVVARFNLSAAISPFRRCARCNAPLETVPKAEVLSRLQPLTQRYYDEFQRCPACGQVYWKGSHYQHLQEFITALRQTPPPVDRDAGDASAKSGSSPHPRGGGDW